MSEPHVIVERDLMTKKVVGAACTACPWTHVGAAGVYPAAEAHVLEPHPATEDEGIFERVEFCSACTSPTYVCGGPH